MNDSMENMCTHVAVCYGLVGGERSPHAAQLIRRAHHLITDAHRAAHMVSTEAA